MRRGGGRRQSRAGRRHDLGPQFLNAFRHDRRRALTRPWRLRRILFALNRLSPSLRMQVMFAPGISLYASALSTHARVFANVGLCLTSVKYKMCTWIVPTLEGFSLTIAFAVKYLQPEDTMIGQGGLRYS